MPLVDEWLSVLDEEIASLERGLEHLKSVVAAVTKRDSRAMETLIDEMARPESREGAAERRRETLRESLAAALGWTPREMTLTRLAGALPPLDRRAVLSRRDRIVQVAAALRREQTLAAMVLKEYSRMNRAILQAILPGHGRATTYDTAGRAPWRTDRGLFDARR
jgi:hypothetical protein